MSKYKQNSIYVTSELAQEEFDKEYNKLYKKDNTIAGIEIQIDSVNKSIILTVYLDSGVGYVTGRATCLEDDLFDIKVGMTIAYLRAKVKQLENEKIDLKRDLRDEIRDEYEAEWLKAEKALFDITDVLDKFYE